MRTHREFVRSPVQLLANAVCDVCKAETHFNDGKGAPVWPCVSPFVESAQVSVELREQSSDPESDGGCVRIIRFDLCPNCFRDHLVTALGKIDAQPTIHVLTR